VYSKLLLKVDLCFWKIQHQVKLYLGTSCVWKTKDYTHMVTTADRE